MRMLHSWATKIVAVLLISVMVVIPAAAGSLNSSDLEFAFGPLDPSGAQSIGAPNPALRQMTSPEMIATDGSAWQLYALWSLASGAARLVYVGITQYGRKRIDQHISEGTKAFNRSKVYQKQYATKDQARVAEQNWINKYDLKNTGANKINSIAPSNPLSSNVRQPYNSAGSRPGERPGARR